VIPNNGTVGTTFDEPGTGFTPFGGVTLHFRRPDSTEATQDKVADVVGSYTHSFTIVEGTMIGLWHYWAVDDATGTPSAEVAFTIN
jgi:hypothetical protein